MVLHQNLLRSECLPVLTDGQNRITFSACMDIVIISVQFYIPGIVEIHSAILNKYIPGIHSMTVKGRIRIQRCTLLFPVHHIFTGAVPPQFDTALGIKWGILKKCVKNTLKHTQPVRIIEPAGHRHQMKALPEPVCPARHTLYKLCLFF